MIREGKLVLQLFPFNYIPIVCVTVSLGSPNVMLFYCVSGKALEMLLLHYMKVN